MLISVLFAMALPALIAAAAIGLGRVLAAAKWSSRGDLLWAAPGIGLGYIAGQAAIAMPSLPPADVTDRIPWLALIATLQAVAEATWPLAPRLRILGRAILLALVIGLMLGPAISAGDLTWTTIGWLSATTVTAVLAWFNLWAMERASLVSDTYRSLILTSGGAVLVLLFSGSAVLCVLIAVLTISLAAAWIAAWHRPPVSGIIVGGAVLTALLIEGLVYASLSPWSALMLAAAPAGTWITRLEPFRRKVGITTTVVGTLTVLIPVGLAVAWAAVSSSSE